MLDTKDYLAPETIGGVDLYAYGLNNLVMYVDPTGHFAITALVVGVLLGAALGGSGFNSFSSSLQ